MNLFQPHQQSDGCSRSCQLLPRPCYCKRKQVLCIPRKKALADIKMSVGESCALCEKKSFSP